MLSFFLAILYSMSGFAGSFEVMDPCGSESVRFSQSLYGAQSHSVGAWSVLTLESNQIPFEGSDLGLNSIFETPMGEDALEILSRKEMRAYGWCYAVDGLVPEKLANQVFIDGNTQSVKWFFAFAHYLEGEWISQCEPVSWEVNGNFLEAMSCEK